MVTFLKKFSAIPNTFIDDMFAMYNPYTIQTDMAINLDAVAKCLGVRKDKVAWQHDAGGRCPYPLPGVFHSVGVPLCG